jgi:ElaA protein
VVEQKCPFLDADGIDFKSAHLCAWKRCDDQSEELVAYCRFIAPNVTFPNETSIGRVVVKASARKCGLGRDLMQRAVDALKSQHPNHSIQ